MIANAIEIAGTLQADGKLILDQRPMLPPGRVRVRVQPFVEEGSEAERLPDVPWLDETLAAPFELPRPGAVVRAQPRVGSERLPDLPTAFSKEL